MTVKPLPVSPTELRQMDREQRDELRLAEREQAQAEVDALLAQLADLPVTAPEFRKLNARLGTVLEAVRATKSDNAWLWSKGLRW